jgi:hypothetical protein
MFIFPTLFVSSADELKAIDTKEECRIISYEHLEHLLLASLGGAILCSSYSVLIYWSDPLLAADIMLHWLNELVSFICSINFLRNDSVSDQQRDPMSH